MFWESLMPEEKPEESQWANPATRRTCFDHMSAFLLMLELRLPHMQGRLDRIEAGCSIMGKELTLGHDQMFSLTLAAKFHDLGMLAVPDTALLRNGPLTDEERLLLNEHPRLGGQLISKAYPDFPDSVEAIWYHHERPDGTGLYGLSGSEIPRLARIVSLVQAVESMARGRPHRPAMPLDDIVNEVRENIDIQFVRREVSAFHSVSAEVYTAVGPDVESPKVTPEDVYSKTV